ncbi:hypothetical protein LLEC1_06180 [Akanthomyces lecanii]|uniref:PSI domain-containing protein n=1 Tax=Cordyceps confragosa TaxID=2714763 RepID=A0A179IL25_CORDF|nr:hypothetical protein LLEC1_06180 [Akanthomyces lecanii]
MGFLAPIPEGSRSQPFSRFNKLNELQNTSTNTNRPQSRIFVASRRHTRTRYQRPEKPESFTARAAVPQVRLPPGQPTKSTFENIHTTPEATSEEHAGPSDSSFDLDSFPIPPSTSSTLSRHGARPPTSCRSSGCTTTHESSVNQRDRTSKSRRYHAQVDGASDPSSSSNRGSVDSALVDAITRNIVQQFRLSSVGRCRQNQANAGASEARSNYSQASSEQDAIDRFAKDLERYAKRQRVRNAGIPRNQSAATLRTVSALMPFRSEFETAGLAVTSKDQANRIDSYITKAVQARAPTDAGPSTKPSHCRPTAGKPSQVDGFVDTEPSDSPNTEISFAPANGMDEWRYAMIDEVPKKKKKKAKAAAGKKPKKHCLSCFDHSPSTATEAGWNQPQKLPTAPMPRFRRGIGPPPPVPPPPRPPQRPPRPAVGLFDADPGRGSHAVPENLTSKSHALSPRMLPSYPRRKDKGKSPVIPRQGSPQPRVLHTNPEGSPVRRKTSSHKKRIPHETTSKQYDRTLGKATPLDLKTAVEEASRPKNNRDSPSKVPDSRADNIDHIGICCRSNRGVPSRANARPNIPRRTSSMSQFMFSSRFDFDDREITDRDVLRGLHIAASAACDEEVDAFVRNQTGLRIRRFLADLMTLESLPVNPPVDKKQWARQRRADMRKLKQQMRRSREINSAAEVARSNFTDAKGDFEHFLRCWAQQDCGRCINTAECSWCPYPRKKKTWACVPNKQQPAFLAPIYNEDVCPARDERWELRSQPFGCRVSTSTVFSTAIAINVTLLVVLVLWLFGLALRHVRRRSRAAAAQQQRFVATTWWTAVPPDDDSQQQHRRGGERQPLLGGQRG